MSSVRAWLLLLFEVTIFSSGKVLSSSCPLELSQSSVVVKFGDPVSVNCTTSLDRFARMGWEASAGGTVLKGNRTFVTWSVPSLTTWSIRPKCYLTISVRNDQCQNPLDVTVYKTPDTVSVLNFTEPMKAGVTSQLLCDIRNIAPVRNLSLTWWKGTKLIDTVIFDNAVVTPQNESHSLSITPEKDDDGAQMRCKVQMNLGPQWTPISSEPHVMVVLYPPSVVSPRQESLDLSVDNKPILNCSADGNPQPEYHFLSPAGVLEAPVTQAVFRPSSPLHPGTYNCTASNHLGSATKVFILQEPPSNPGMTAGIVVAVVIIIGLAMAFVVWRKKSLSCSSQMR